MGERLHLHAARSRLAREQLDLAEGQLARQRHARGAQARRRLDSGDVVRVHLGRDVQARLRQHLAQRRGKADVLHDERVDARPVRPARRVQRRAHLVGKHGDVHRHVHARAAQMGVRARLRERLRGEVVRSAAGVERFHAQVHGIRARAHRGMQRGHAARRGEKLDPACGAGRATLGGVRGGCGFVCVGAGGMCVHGGILAGGRYDDRGDTGS